MADDLAVRVLKLSQSWPAHEKHTVGGQLCRAALSAACNLVEATSRKSKKERLRFIEIADGSLREAGYLLSVVTRVGLVSTELGTTLAALHEEATSAMSRRRSSATSGLDKPSRQGKRRRQRAKEQARQPLMTDVAPPTPLS